MRSFALCAERGFIKRPFAIFMLLTSHVANRQAKTLKTMYPCIRKRLKVFLVLP